MNISYKTRKSLEKIGLTSYEIRTYISLLKENELTASDLSQRSGVPYSKIYEILGSLESKGWVGSDESRPTKYFARSPTTGLEYTRQNFELEFKENQSTILNELIPLYEKSGTNEKPDIWVLTGVVNISIKILEMIELCKNEVMIALPEIGEHLVKQSIPKLRSLHDKGIKITILISDKIDTRYLKPIYNIAKIKIKKSLFGSGIICDKRYVIILFGKTKKLDEYIAIWADHIGLAGFAKEYFEYLLKDSEEVIL